MKNKTIVFTKAYTAELIESELREPERDEVVVRMSVSSISNGTERANFTGDPNISIYEVCTEAHFPRTVGYSSAGIVERVGADVHDLKAGDRVAMVGSVHSKYVVLNRNNVYKINSDKIGLNSAALWYIACFPAAAIRKCRLEFGESALVMGLGVLGQIAIKLLSLAGAAPIVAVDIDPEKRKRALALGADYAFDPLEENFAQKVKDATDGGANVAIEATGNGKALDGCLDCMKKFGRVALLGCTRDRDFTIDYYRKVHGPGITLVGAHTMARPVGESFGGWWCTRDEMNALQKLTLCGRLDLSDLIDEIHKPEEAQEVFTRLATEKSFPTVQFNWEE